MAGQAVTGGRREGVKTSWLRRAACVSGWIAACVIAACQVVSAPAQKWVPLYPVCFEGSRDDDLRDMKLPTTERFSEVFRRYMDWSDIRLLYRKSDGLLLAEKSVWERHVARLGDSALTATAHAMDVLYTEEMGIGWNTRLPGGDVQLLDCALVEAMAVRGERPLVQRALPAE